MQIVTAATVDVALVARERPLETTSRLNHEPHSDSREKTIDANETMLCAVHRTAGTTIYVLTSTMPQEGQGKITHMSWYVHSYVTEYHTCIVTPIVELHIPLPKMTTFLVELMVVVRPTPVTHRLLLRRILCALDSDIACTLNEKGHWKSIDFANK